MREQKMEVGNKTGIATAPVMAAEMMDGTSEFVPSSLGDEREFARVRGSYSETAEPVGSVPPPAMNETVMSEPMLTQLIDKLGARIAFERSGVRLYSALLSKYDSYGSYPGGPERADLESIRDEELGHFHLLAEIVSELGGDPTAVTPAADVEATLTRGVLDVLVDPRTDLAESLQGILIAELADNDSWLLLRQLAHRAGHADLAHGCAVAEEHERDHLQRVRTWLSAATEIA